MNAPTRRIAGWSTPECDALRDMVDRFTKKEVVPFLPQWEKEGALPRILHKKAADLGLLELGVD